jgi:hypothetical protein
MRAGSLVLGALFHAATTAAVFAQAGGGTPPSVEQLAARLDAAHRGGAKDLAVTSFRAAITVQQRRGDSVSVDLNVDFQLPKAIRYRVVEEGVAVERGFDPELGGWVRSEGRVVALTDRAHEKEAEQVQKEIRLCRQILAFLDPGRVVARLREPTAVAEKELVVSRGLRFDRCFVVSGTADGFPTYALGKGGERSRLTLWVDATSDLLVAVAAHPLDDKGVPATAGELILLQDMKAHEGLLLPTKLTAYTVPEAGKPEPSVTLLLTAIELNRKFGDHHFERPKE